MTPTAAAIIASVFEPIGEKQTVVPATVGYGAGTRETEGLPNVLRVVVDLTSEHAGYRTSVHPLQKLLVAPLGAAIDATAFGGDDPLSAARLLILLALTAQGIGVGWLVYQWTDGSLLASLGAAAVWGTSFSTVLAASLPESAAVSGLAALLPLVYLGTRAGRAWTTRESIAWALIGVVGIGLTITQVVHWLIAIAVRATLARRAPGSTGATLGRGLATTGVVFAVLVAVGVTAQSQLFEGTPNPFAASPLAGEEPFLRTASLSAAPLAHVTRLVAHFVVRKFATGADATLLPLAALLHGIGFVMITRLDDELAGLQSLWSLIGVSVFCAVLIIVQRATDLARYRWLLFFAGAGGLLLPLVPGLGANINGARIWVSLGPINFQPGEFAKIALAIFFAAYFAENRELIAAKTWKVGPLRLPEPRFILPVLVAWGFAVVVMVGQRDLGSSLLFFTLFVVMIWVATERVGWLLLGAVPDPAAHRDTFSAEFVHRRRGERLQVFDGL